MRAPENRNARLAPGVGNRDGFENVWTSTDTRPLQDPQPVTSHRRLDWERLEALEQVARWRHDLTSRIARAQLIFEMADTESVDTDEIAAEVKAFKRVCAGLMA